MVDKASPEYRNLLVLLLLGSRDITDEQPDLPQVGVPPFLAQLSSQVF